MSAFFPWRPISRQSAGRGKKVSVWILGIHTAFNRPAVELYVALRDRKLFSRGDTDHLLDEIDASDQFSDRMLDLQSCVHLEEVKAFVLPRDKLDSPRAVVTDRLGKRDRLIAHLLSCRRIKQRTWRLFDHLLIAPLDRAFALAKVDDVAVLVAKHLDFDVARIGDEFLDEYPFVAERRFRFRTGAREPFSDLGLAVRDAHALAAAARTRLDHHGIADLLGNLDRLRLAFDHPEMPRHRRDLGGSSGLL